MSKTIDITSKLTNDKPKLRITDELEFEIDNRKNTVLEAQKIIDENEATSISVIDEVLGLFLGKDAVNKINELDLSFKNYQVIFTAVMAGAMGEDYETMEARMSESIPSQQ